MPDPLDTPPLPCPSCRLEGRGGGTRIGNRRQHCQTCNNFAQNVLRLAAKKLREEHPEEYQAIRLRVELDLYPQVIEDFELRERLAPAQPAGAAS